VRIMSPFDIIIIHVMREHLFIVDHMFGYRPMFNMVHLYIYCLFVMKLFRKPCVM